MVLNGTSPENLRTKEVQRQMMLDEKTIEVIERVLANGSSVEVKTEKNQIVVIRTWQEAAEQRFQSTN